MIRKLVIVLVAVLVLLATSGLLLRRLLDPEAVRATFASQASAVLGQPVTVGAVDWALSSHPRVVLSEVSVGAPAAVTFARIEVTAGLRALLSKRVDQARIAIIGSRVTLPLPFIIDTGAGGAAAVGAGGGLAIGTVDRISLQDIELVVGDKVLRLDVEASLTASGPALNSPPEPDRRADRLIVTRARLRSDRTAIDASGEFTSLTARRGVFTATADRLDLDELLAIMSGLSRPGPQAASQADEPSAPAAPLDVRLDLEAAQGRLLGIELAKIATRIALTRQGVTLEPFGVAVFDGTVSGRLRLDTAQKPSRASLAARIVGVDVARLAAFAGSPGTLTGRLGGQIDLQAEAGAPDTVFRTARGTASLAVTDGTVPGLDLVGPVVLAFGRPDATRSEPRSDAFSSLSGTFALADGLLRSDDLSMRSRDLDMRGQGTLRVAGAAVDVQADLILSEDLSSQAGRDLYRYAREGTRVVVPATITGQLPSPTVSVNVGAAAGRALRNTLEDQLKKGLERLIKP